MLVVRAVIGAVWIGFAAGVVGVGLAETPPAATPPVVPANAGAAPTAKIAMLQKNALRVRARKTGTSFVGLRG